MPQDSMGRPIGIGDRVRFRGKEYTIKNFSYSKSPFGTATIEFEEDQHTPEAADEISVDLIWRKSSPEDVTCYEGKGQSPA